MEEGGTIGLYPKGGLMVINETKLRDKKAERYVEKMHTRKKEVNQDRLEENLSEQKDKEEETINRRREESDRMRQIIKEHEEGMARDLQRIKELEQEVRRRKSAREEEEKIDFFPAWKPVQGVMKNTEEEEQYMTIGEDGRPYIAVRRKQEERKENEQEEANPMISNQREEEAGLKKKNNI